MLGITTVLGGVKCALKVIHVRSDVNPSTERRCSLRGRSRSQRREFRERVECEVDLGHRAGGPVSLDSGHERRIEVGGRD